MAAKERLYIAFAFVASAIAGYGSIRLAQIILIEGSFKPLIDESSRGLEFIGLVVFFATLALMIKRVDAIQKERLERVRKEFEQRSRDAQRLG